MTKNSKLVGMFRKLIFPIVILFFVSSCLEDEPIETNAIQDKYYLELSQAKIIAENIYFEKPSKSSNINKGGLSELINRNVREIIEFKNINGINSFYVINYIENGFVILSSDIRVQPILAYSENRNFDVNEDNEYPTGLQFWIEDTKNQISDIQKSNLKQTDEIKQVWKDVQITNPSLFLKDPPIGCYEHTETTTIGPLLSSKWFQDGGFNDALPYINCNGSSFQVYAGCVPIALGQVMKFYEYPKNYNWSSMPLTYATTTTANFIKDIHNAIGVLFPGNPFYQCNATGVSSSANMGTVLKNQFGYSSANWSNYDYNTVKNNLNYNRPVILSGDNGTVGHMWVCDGYRQTTRYYDDCTSNNFLFFI